MVDKITIGIGFQIACPFCKDCDIRKIVGFEFTSSEDFVYIKLECGHSIPMWSK